MLLLLCLSLLLCFDVITVVAFVVIIVTSSRSLSFYLHSSSTRTILRSMSTLVEISCSEVTVEKHSKSDQPQNCAAWPFVCSSNTHPEFGVCLFEATALLVAGIRFV